MSDREQELFDDPPGGASGKGGGNVARPGSHADVPAHETDGVLRGLMDENFIQYASYVITDRAIPYLYDGLKPVQRRILWSLHRNDDGKFIKVANIVGYTMQFHPHGDASIADALVNLTNKRYLIEGQGNFGNVFTGDPAAASRYIECRLTDLARKELFNDHLTEGVPSYDGRNKEPVQLPCKLPLLLMLGAEGIAVGLSTRILPHNFPELLEAQIAVLRKKPFQLYPDFQQGGLMDVSEYEDGAGRVKVRAQIEAKGKSTLIIRQVPYGTTTESLIASVEDASKKKKIKIRSIQDYTAEQVELHVHLAAGEKADVAMQALYAFTDCESSVNSSIVVIRDNRPVEMTVSEVIKYNTAQLVDILKQELEYERARLLDEFHHKTLAQIFIENRIYKQIEECKTYKDVQQAVLDGVNKFRKMLRRDVTTEDVEMLLALRIKRISRFDINQNKKEIGDILKKLEEVEKNLNGLTKYAIKYLQELLKKYGKHYPRQTVIEGGFEKVELRELTASEHKIQYNRQEGYLGYAVKGDELFECSSLDKLMLVWKDGRYKVVSPPDKLFVGKDLEYCQLADRDKVMTAVYTSGPITYFKKFTFGGTIMNKEYRLAPPESKVLLFDDSEPEVLFVKYKPAKNQRINQQTFKLKKLTVKGAKAKGNQMTVKAIANLGIKKPRNWDDSEVHDTNAEMMDF